MNDDDFKVLRGIEPPPVSDDARRRAVNAGLMAFDMAAREKNFIDPTKGVSRWQRLKSIVPSLKGNWIMDSRHLVPAGTAALALLILAPLAYQLYSSTRLPAYQQGNPNPDIATGPARPVAPARPALDAPRPSVVAEVPAPKTTVKPAAAPTVAPEAATATTIAPQQQAAATVAPQPEAAPTVVPHSDSTPAVAPQAASAPTLAAQPAATAAVAPQPEPARAIAQQPERAQSVTPQPAAQLAATPPATPQPAAAPPATTAVAATAPVVTAAPAEPANIAAAPAPTAPASQPPAIAGVAVDADAAGKPAAMAPPMDSRDMLAAAESLAKDTSKAESTMAQAAAPAAMAAPPPAGMLGMMARSADAAPVSRPVAVSVVPPATGDKFQSFTESAQKAVATDPVSTFSIDVDTASYSYVRRALNEGRIPEPDAVRLEEMINYFPYDYPAATDASEPFKPTISVFPTPWNKSTELMQVGIRGYDPPAATRKPANLVFLIDTSGSMDEPDKLPLLQRALTLLVNTMSADDTVSIVAYAGSAGVVLEPTRASEKSKILKALDDLSAGGSTAGAEGIELAYNLAIEHKVDGNNRVILATDGDFNVGISDPAQLKQFIKQKRQAGIGLSVLGFGEGNLDDETMQALAQNGDGNASYIDSLSEAQKVLVKEAGSTLDTIARDVKIQVEFNPATVSSYRLIGYETRALNREDFNNDKVDAGDVGAGHTVTALYEITPAGAGTVPPVDPLRYGSAAPAAPAAAPPNGKSDELADFKLRYKLPGSDTSKLIEQPVTSAMVVGNINSASTDARWAAAVAAFGQKLKGSDYAGMMSYADIATLARGARGSDPDGYRSEFINLVGLAGGLSGTDSTPQPAPTPEPPIVN